jgi:hypothetical protein
MAFLVAAQIYMIGHESRLRMNALAAVVGLVIIGAACISRVAQTFLPSETEMALANSEGERLRATVIRLRMRSVRLRRTAFISILLIVVALIGGLTLFYLAADISDPSLFRVLDSSVEERAVAERRLDVTSDYLRRRITLAPSVRGDELERIERVAAGLHRDAVQLAASDRAVREALAAMRGEDQTRRMISTITTRVGAVLILVFLVQILVALYRYSTRLANYYDARTDALELAVSDGGGIDENRLANMANIIAPERIEFGKEPKTPMDQALEVARLLVSAKDQARPPAA